MTGKELDLLLEKDSIHLTITTQFFPVGTTQIEVCLLLLHDLN